MLEDLVLSYMDKRRKAGSVTTLADTDIQLMFDSRPKR